ncbi:MAG: RNA polymerase sigma factor [Myxococcota bacterium]
MAASSTRAPYLRLVSDADSFEVGDATLRRGLIRREKWAAAAMWKRFAPKIFGLISQSLARPNEAEELTQEVMLRVLGEASNPRRAKTFPALVYGETARVLEREFRRVNRLRRFWRRPRRVALELIGVSDRAERAALMRLYDVLDQLSSAERVCFVLHEFESLTEVDIAEALDASLPKVRKRLARAVAKVHALIDCDPVLAGFLTDEKAPRRDLREGA